MKASTIRKLYAEQDDGGRVHLRPALGNDRAGRRRRPKGEVEWIEGPDVSGYFGVRTLTNTLWFITTRCSTRASSFRYGWVPKQTFCTLAMARAMLYHKTGSVSLADVASELGIGVKGDEVERASGMNLAALKANPEQYARYVDYAKTDVALCREAFFKMLDLGFPVWSWR